MDFATQHFLFLHKNHVLKTLFFRSLHGTYKGLGKRNQCRKQERLKEEGGEGSCLVEIPTMGSIKDGRGLSTFAVTCGLLSQYLKDNKAGFGCLIGKPDVICQPSATMSLLPGLDLPVKHEGEPKEVTSGGTAMELFPQHTFEVKQTDSREPEKAQLTIFYGGSVLVFDDFPAEKARDLMKLASKGTPTPSHPATPTAHVDVVLQLNSTALLSTAVTSPAVTQQASGPPHPTDMPMARRASLHRFLEKRKDRINARAPYHVNGYPAAARVKKEESEAWLGLGSVVSNPSSM